MASAELTANAKKFMALAEQDDIQAQYIIGNYYRHGSHGLEQYTERAIKYLSDAANNTKTTARNTNFRSETVKNAEYALAEIYETGWWAPGRTTYIDEDLDKSLYWYKRAKTSGHQLASDARIKEITRRINSK